MRDTSSLTIALVTSFATLIAEPAQGQVDVETMALYDGYAVAHGDLVQGVDGRFYGTSARGGANTTGYIYRTSKTGTFEKLYDFPATDQSASGIGGSNVGGAYPQAGVVFGPDGALYGTTVFGGLSGRGTIFKLTLTGPLPVLTTLHEFPALLPDDSNIGGAMPFSALVLAPDGNFYGNTDYGGMGANGTIFRMSPGGAFTTLYEFTASSGAQTNSDGARPIFRMTLGPDGALYGAAPHGGLAAYGTLYRITLAGGFTVLQSFGSNASDPIVPYTVTFGADAAIYGTTFQGGVFNAGTIFRWSPSDGLRAVYEFSDSEDGANPYRTALVLDDDGAFYGNTSFNDGYGGVIFRFKPGQSYQTLYTFGQERGLNLPETTLVRGDDGLYYGSASEGDPEFGPVNGGIYRFSRSLPGKVDFSLSARKISLGQSVTLSWADPQYLYCFGHRSPELGWNGVGLPTTGSQAFAPTAVGTYAFQVSCDNNHSKHPSGSKTLWLEVDPTPPAVPPTGGGAPSVPMLLILALCAQARREWRRQ